MGLNSISHLNPPMTKLKQSIIGHFQNSMDDFLDDITDGLESYVSRGLLTADYAFKTKELYIVYTNYCDETRAKPMKYKNFFRHLMNSDFVTKSRVGSSNKYQIKKP